MISLELKKSYFEELLGKTMSQNYEATEVRTNLSLKAIRQALTLISFKEYPDLEDAATTHFIKDSVHITVTVLTSFMTVLDVEIDEYPYLDCGVSQEIEQTKTDPETGMVICCFNCESYDREDGFCVWCEEYTQEQERCQLFKPVM